MSKKRFEIIETPNKCSVGYNYTVCDTKDELCEIFCRTNLCEADEICEFLNKQEDKINELSDVCEHYKSMIVSSFSFRK